MGMNAKNTKQNDLLLADLTPSTEQADAVVGGRKDSQGTGSSGAGSGIGEKWSLADFWYWAVTSRY